jgi:large subunit GTPase 1
VTPFEKNLEVWRQLWRVLERSDLVCQVVDARDPLRYRCPDLEAYVDELGAGAKHHLLLLNKADLLPVATRRAWAAYFEEQDIDFIFWSALAATETRTEEVGHAVTAPLPDNPPPPPAGMVRTGARVVGREELLRLLEARAAAAAMCEESAESAEGHSEGQEREEAGDTDPRFGSAPRRVVVGLVGYPNVGKSSTLNALVGAKRTGVGSTPGKTKHFQTFNLSDTLQLADCPGLVFPSTSDGRAELVAAGVLPIDKLTDVVGPIDVVARRVPRAQLERLYALRLPRPAMHEDQNRAPTGRELLRGYAASRGLTSGAGLPDETRAGRAILKDYTSGKLLFYEWPPGVAVPEREEEEWETDGDDDDEAPGAACRPDDESGGADWSSGDGEEEEEGGSDGEFGDGPGEPHRSVHHQQQQQQRVLSPPSTTSSAAVGDALLGELRALGLAGGDKKDRPGVVRAPHKLQKKGKKEKLRRLARGPMAPEGIGGQLITGRRGGLMPASVQIQATPEFLPALMRHSAGIASGGARERTTSARTAIPQPTDDGEEEE